MGRIQEALERAEISRDQIRHQAQHAVKLVHQKGSMIGKEQIFESHSILLGRGPHNDVAYDPFDDSTVSSQHAEIRPEGDDYIIYDMGSLNGTFVNGFSIRRAQILPGDLIALGRQGPTFEFTVDAIGDVSAKAPEPVNHYASLDHLDGSTKEFPDTEKTPIQAAAPAKSPNTLLTVILIGIILDVVINLIRMF